MKSKEQVKPYPTRLEPELYEWVKRNAANGDRSINAELNRVIRKAKEAEQQKAA